MAQITQEQIIKALSAIVDPDKQQDVVSLGMISGLAVKNGHVAFAIEVEPERGPSLETLRKTAEKAVHDLPGVISVSAVLTAQRPAQPAQQGHTPHGQGQGQPQRARLLESVGAVIAVASGKGGVGKSTTSVNLALALAALGLRVGLLDADVFGPSAPRMMGLSGKQPTSPDGKRIIPLENHGIKVMSMGFMVPEESPIVWRGPMVMGALEQMMRDVEWGDLDVMIIDMPPGTGDTQLTISQRVPLAGAVIVSTPQDIALLDARKGLNMFRKVDVPVLGIIENMSLFICPNCGHEAHIFGHGGAKAEAAKLETDFLGEVPLHMQIRETSDEGRPVVATDPTGRHAELYRAIAERIWDKVAQSGKSAGPKIVME